MHSYIHVLFTCRVLMFSLLSLNPLKRVKSWNESFAHASLRSKPISRDCRSAASDASRLRYVSSFLQRILLCYIHICTILNFRLCHPQSIVNSFVVSYIWMSVIRITCDIAQVLRRGSTARSVRCERWIKQTIGAYRNAQQVWLVRAGKRCYVREAGRTKRFTHYCRSCVLLSLVTYDDRLAMPLTASTFIDLTRDTESAVYAYIQNSIFAPFSMRKRNRPRETGMFNFLWYWFVSYWEHFPCDAYNNYYSIYHVWDASTRDWKRDNGERQSN